MTNENEDFKVNISNVTSLVADTTEDKNYFEILNSEHIKRKKIRRRSSSQLSKEFECPICERRLSRRKNLEMHIKKLHPNGGVCVCVFLDALQNFNCKF